MKKILNINSGRTQILLALMGVSLMMGFQNCAPGTLMTSTTSSSVFSVGDGSMDSTSNDKIAYQVNYSENILTSMLTVTGVTPNNTTLSSYNDKKTKISETGLANTITAPMWLAVTNLAGDVCRNLVTQEVALTSTNRSFFSQVDFTQGPSKVSASIQNDVIRRMARAYWGRNETVQELSLIKGATSSSFTGVTDNGATTQNEMLFICAAMLASLDSQKL